MTYLIGQSVKTAHGSGIITCIEKENGIQSYFIEFESGHSEWYTEPEFN